MRVKPVEAMTLEELFTALSYGEFSNLSIGCDGTGSIKEDQHNKIIGYANDALRDLYMRFILSTKTVLIQQNEGITNYHLDPRFSTVHGEEGQHHYIKDLPEEPFLGDIVKILMVFDEYGREITLNDEDDPLSMFTPYFNVLQVPDPKNGKLMSVTYQTRHAVLERDDLEQEIDLPYFLEGALKNYIAYKTYSHMNGQENSVKAQEHLGLYELACAGVIEQDLANTSVSNTNTKFEKRRWQ